MCGIVGFTRDPQQPRERDLAIIGRMLSPIAHRGPDERGTYVGQNLALGHLRLSIVDLIGGHQPRVDSDSGDVLVFNGEIYGFARLANELKSTGAQLVDRSDTEVLFRLLQRQGVANTLDRIDGMFAFAFFEGRTQRLYLARDRFGEKPLYYFERDGAIVFGSEPSSVLRHPIAEGASIDLDAVQTFLNYEYLPGDRSIRRGLRKVLPGHYVSFASGRSESHCYWRACPEEQGTNNESEASRLDRLDDILERSVRDRLVADVPVGVFLSGGIDSSLIAAIVSRHAPGLTAFTLSMPGASYDEAPAARQLASSLGLHHEVVELDERGLKDAFVAVTSKMDEPFADASLLPTWLLCRAARERVTVALGGDGADELFAGYVSFKANKIAHCLSAIPSSFGAAFRAGLSYLPHNSNYMSFDFLLRQISQGFGVHPAGQWVACMAPFSPECLNSLWKDDVILPSWDAMIPIGDRLSSRGKRRWSTAELIYMFIQTYLPEDILQKVDRASMYVSLEVRAPYLGREFSEYALSLPSRDKIRGLETKSLFKKLALRHLPRSTVERKKHGFALPVGALLRGLLKEPVGDVLCGNGSVLHEWFRRDRIEQLWSEHKLGKKDHRKQIWTLFSLATAVHNTRSNHN